MMDRKALDAALEKLAREIGHAQGLIESEWGSCEADLDDAFEELNALLADNAA
jgi:hypothetical protein